MMRAWLAGVMVGGLALAGGAGCGSSTIQEGVPADAKYVPPLTQPNMGGTKGNPVANAKKAQAEAAKAGKADDGAAESKP
jgi:hypothetical protein